MPGYELCLGTCVNFNFDLSTIRPPLQALVCLNKCNNSESHKVRCVTGYHIIRANWKAGDEQGAAKWCAMCLAAKLRVYGSHADKMHIARKLTNSPLSHRFKI